jgi:hypothetical protein
MRQLIARTGFAAWYGRDEYDEHPVQVMWERVADALLAGPLAHLRSELTAAREERDLAVQTAAGALEQLRESALQHIARDVTDEQAATEIANARDFQSMLARIIHRHGRGLDITDTLAGARDLLARKGSLSPLRSPTPPEHDTEETRDAS